MKNWNFLPVLGFAFAAAAACGSNPELVAGTGGGFGGASGNGGDGNPIDVVGGASGAGDGGTGGVADPCAALNCPPDQHCEVSGDEGICVGNDCLTLVCGEEEICTKTTDGAICEDKCTGDVDCPESQYCDLATGECRDDDCDPGEQICDGEAVLECSPNGSTMEEQFVCGSPAPGYDSQCQEPAGNEAECPCRDDWDCPAHTVCEAGKCEGSGQEPTCRLPAEPMENVLPVNEITWGGTFSARQAAGSPFPDSAQVVLTPLVANLNDDNGDGLIDERDTPEIIFTTFCNSDYTKNGILRAIHGGGDPAVKGKDYFATCADGKTWHEGDALDAVDCDCGDGILDATASVAVGDLDNDGIPEIVGVHETDGIVIYNNRGEVISHTAGLTGGNPGPSLANVDNEGFAEIVVGRNLYTLTTDANNKLTILDRFEGNDAEGKNGQGPVSCVADLVGDRRMEIVAGGTLYRYPVAPAGVTARADCTGSETGEEKSWCDGDLIVEWDNGSEGFCAVADVLGADQVNMPGPDNPLDGVPEVIVVTGGNLRVINSQDGSTQRDIAMGVGSRAGAPNVDDFDGDGFPEVGTAGGTGYTVIDFQDATTECPAWTTTGMDQSTDPRTPPAIVCAQDSDCGDTAKFACNENTSGCVCLHNGWKRQTEDDSSQVTGSSVFDFNGDGAAEVVYNDECAFRVYRGGDGHVLFEEPSESRTRIEYPVVADVDNDGNAEIVFATTNESGFCSQNKDSSYNNGIEVWGEANDLWVSARRIWNQHAYHITNVTEGGGIPLIEPPNWLLYNGRDYNTYRSNPRSFGIAPDLMIKGIQLSSPDAACGELSSLLDITVEITNIGDLRVSDFVVGFYGVWTAAPLDEALLDGGAAPITATVTQALEPGDVVFVTVSYNSANNTPGVLPDLVRAVVDDTDLSRECDEANNSVEKDVTAGLQVPDLTIEIGVVTASCPDPVVPTTVTNIGSSPASNYVVRYYAGNPAAGGSALQEVTRPGPLAPGASDSFDTPLTTFPENRTVVVWGVVDPDNAIEECNDGNNSDAADNAVGCGVIK